MTDLVANFLNQINVAQLAAIGVMFWFFYTRLNTKIEQVETRLIEKIDKLEDRFNKLEDRFNKLETRVAVIESKLTDISNNVTHLMWQNQIPHRDAQEK